METSEIRLKLSGIKFDVTVFERDYEDETILYADRMVEVESSECIFEPSEIIVPKTDETVREYLQRQGCKDRIPDPSDVAEATENIWFTYDIERPDGEVGTVYAAYMYYDEYPHRQENNAYIVLDDCLELCRRYRDNDDGDGNILVDFYIPPKQDLLDTKIGAIAEQHKSVILENIEKITDALDKQNTQ